MPRTFIRQDAQIRESVLYDDTVAAGSTMETAMASIEGDLNALRSQMKRGMWADSAGNWYDDIQTYNSKKRGINTISNNLNTVEEQRFLFRTQILTDVTVSAAQNWEVLSVAGGEAPTQTAAVGAVTTEGAVVAYNASFGAHSLAEVAGPNALQPKNLCVVRDASTGQPLQSGGKDIYALIQSESNTDGHTFDDSSNRVQLSFVIENGTGDDLIACPVVDIATEVINYSYVRRLAYVNLPEYAFLAGVWVDQAASVDVTLDNAVDNQSGPVTQQQSIEWRIDDTYTLKFQDSTGGKDLIALLPNAAGDEVEINSDYLDVNLTNPADISDGIKVDTGGTEIDVGVNAGVIETTSTNDLRLLGAGEMYLDDGNQTGSTWAQTNGIKLSDTTSEWDSFETTFGEVSLLNAIVQASSAVARNKTSAKLTSNVAADTNVTGAGGTPNLDAQLGDYSSATFVTDVDVFLNGELLRNGPDASANHDVYPGDTPANGDLKFEFALHGTGSKPDQLTTIIY